METVPPFVSGRSADCLLISDGASFSENHPYRTKHKHSQDDNPCAEVAGARLL